MSFGPRIPVEKQNSSSVKPKKKKNRKRGTRLLLANLAQVLNACEKAGLEPKLRHNVVFTSAGYVLPPIDKKTRWVARSVPSKGKYADDDGDD